MKRRKVNPFHVYVSHKRGRVIAENPGMAHKDVTRLLSMRWKCMSLQEKSVYAMKHCMNPFMVFSTQRRKEFLKTDASLRNREVSKLLAAEWHAMTVEEKAPFVEESQRLTDLRKVDLLVKQEWRGHFGNLFELQSSRELGPIDKSHVCLSVCLSVCYIIILNFSATSLSYQLIKLKTEDRNLTVMNCCWTCLTYFLVPPEESMVFDFFEIVLSVCSNEPFFRQTCIIILYLLKN